MDVRRRSFYIFTNNVCNFFFIVFNTIPTYFNEFICNLVQILQIIIMDEDTRNKIINYIKKRFLNFIQRKYLNPNCTETFKLDDLVARSSFEDIFYF